MGKAQTQTVTAFEAKTRLGRLLDRVEAGEELLITRHGQPVAKLVPLRENAARELEDVLARVTRLRQSLAARGVRVSRDEVRAWRNEGRR
jgi:prevent-host-death family protein